MSMKKVCVLGLGYIGLPTATFIASAGYRVLGVDINNQYVDAVNSGKLPFVERGLARLLESVVDNGLLTAQCNPAEADIFVIAVPTPFKNDHQLDDTYIKSACDSISPYLKNGDLVILESTSSPGTTDNMADYLSGNTGLPALRNGSAEGASGFHFAHCPERVLPGKIVEEMRSNSRVIGASSPIAAKMTVDLYSAFCDGELILTDPVTAEMAKLTENSFRDVNIAFANELSKICDKLSIDVRELITIANKHPRVNVLQPGIGVGGHCIAVDPWFIVSADPKQAKLIKAARLINDSMPSFTYGKIHDEIQSRGNITTVSLLGLAFKPNIDDLRESPAVDVCKLAAENHPSIQFLIAEPNAKRLPDELASLPNVKLVGLHEAIESTDLVVSLVAHDEFLNAKSSSNNKEIFFDLIGMW